MADNQKVIRHFPVPTHFYRSEMRQICIERKVQAPRDDVLWLCLKENRFNSFSSIITFLCFHLI
jgi:hypothetical protein